jgi:KEOPS complex subunit Cgi121
VGAWLATYDEVASAVGLRAQAVDADAVCGREHAVSALLHARRAFERGYNLARTLETEWALCVAGVRQVSSALAMVGVREGTSRFAVLLGFEGDALPPEEAVAAFLRGTGLARDDSVLGPKQGALRRLGVGEAELRAVPGDRWVELALERVALLDLER